MNIIFQVNDYYKSNSNPRPSRDKLTSAILDAISDWDLIELSQKYLKDFDIEL